MMRDWRAIASTLALVAFAAPASVAVGRDAAAQAAPRIASKARPAVSPVVRPNSERWEMTSAITGRKYRIYVAKPDPKIPPPPGGFPVIYLNDGDFEFHSAADTLGLQTLSRETRPAYIVGIGYVGDLDYLSRSRFADMTPSQPDPATQTKLASSPLMKGAVFGQAELYHRFMMEELRPMIEANYPVDRQDATLFGHSLGGLFALHVLFNHPDAYRTYLVNSPSINWGGGTVLKDEPRLTSLMTAGKVAPRVLFTAGEWEEKLADHAKPPPGITREQMQAGLKAFGLVTNVVGVAERLAKVSAPAGTRVEKVVFADETHSSVVLAAISRGVRFALPLEP